MDLLELTLPTIAENLALDEALLDALEQTRNPVNLLRIWESPDYAVILGRGTCAEKEIDLAACEQDAVPVLRRCSGGTAVVAGPGCLMYALLFSFQNTPEVRTVDAAHALVMRRLCEGLRRLDPQVEFQGLCDLTLDNRKFSGNALRCKRDSLLYHGTVLYDFPLQKISKYLRSPPREPDYRQGREHDLFVRNFPATGHQLRDMIRTAWSAVNVCDDWPESRTDQLVKTKYARSSWNRRL